MKKTSLHLATSEIVDTVTLNELCSSCNVSAEWVIELVDHGILDPVGTDVHPVQRFESSCLTRAVRAVRLSRDMGINLSGIALVLDLLEERDRLFRRLARFEASETQAE